MTAASIRVGQPCSSCGVPMLRGCNGYRPAPPGFRRHAGFGRCKQCTRRPPVRGTLTGLERGKYAEPADAVVVQRLIDGERTPSNPADRREAVLRLTRGGPDELRSAAAIARHLRISQRTVVRYRTQARLDVTVAQVRKVSAA